MSDGPPTQAVIVAGGRGTRLGALTDDRPKPLVEVAGRPFLDHLMALLRDQGLTRQLLLLGYRAEMIQAHVGDGSALGVAATHLVTPPEVHTLTRLRDAAQRGALDETFLLVYCDNFWPLSLERAWADYVAAGRPAAQVTVYANDDGFTRDNVRIGDGGRVEAYDRTRSAPGLAGVDIGFVLLRRDALDGLPDVDAQVEHVLYPRLVARGALYAHVTGHRYYDVGKLDRLAATERFLRREPAVILDRDGVLNVKPPRAHYVTRPSEFVWRDGSLDALRTFADAGWRTFVVSNQAGIARGAMTHSGLAAVHARMVREAEEAGGRIDAIYVCPHGWDDGCACRKPRPGMLFAAQREHDLDLSRTTFVGDDERDAQAAAAAGAPSVLLDERTSLADVAQRLIHHTGGLIAV
ncbi:MAG TPA: HAD-IIIA family hydrolase [Solirubrobacteraceae bacterium]|nr:HAD-IIIA family hydrolase [Solirubrobacteraceae bacterium]